MSIKEIHTASLAQQAALKRGKQAAKRKKKRKGKKLDVTSKKAKELAKKKALERYDKKTWKNMATDDESLRKADKEGRKRQAVKWTPNGLIPIEESIVAKTNRPRTRKLIDEPRE